MAITVPEAGLQGQKLSDFIDTINMMMADYVEEGSAEQTLDGSETRFRLPDTNIVEDSETVRLTSGETTTTLGRNTSYEIGYQSGWIQLSDDYEADDIVSAEYQYRHWSDDEVVAAANRGIYYLAKYYPIIAEDSFTASNMTYEYDAPVDDDDVKIAARILSLHMQEYSGGPWVRLTQWDQNTLYDEEAGDMIVDTIRLRRAVGGDSTIKVRYVRKPIAITTAQTESFEITALFPTKGVNALLLYVCWQLLALRVIPRVRSDILPNPQGERSTKVTEMLQAAQYCKFMLDAEIEMTRYQQLERHLYKGWASA